MLGGFIPPMRSWFFAAPTPLAKPVTVVPIRMMTAAAASKSLR